MRIKPYIDPQGIPREREQATYKPVIVNECGRLFIGLVPKGEGLTCLEYARIFSLALRPGADPEEVRCFAEWLNNLEGLNAIYCPEPDPRPTYPNIVPLKAA